MASCHQIDNVHEPLRVHDTRSLQMVLIEAEVPSPVTGVLSPCASKACWLVTPHYLVCIRFGVSPTQTFTGAGHFTSWVPSTWIPKTPAVDPKHDLIRRQVGLVTGYRTNGTPASWQLPQGYLKNSDRARTSVFSAFLVFAERLEHLSCGRAGAATRSRVR